MYRYVGYEKTRYADWRKKFHAIHARFLGLKTKWKCKVGQISRLPLRNAMYTLIQCHSVMSCSEDINE